MFAANVGQVVVRVGFPLVGFEFGDLLEAMVGVVVVATLGASEVVARRRRAGPHKGGCDDCFCNSLFVSALSV